MKERLQPDLELHVGFKDKYVNVRTCKAKILKTTFICKEERGNQVFNSEELEKTPPYIKRSFLKMQKVLN